jgi:hypothetical protein
MILNDAGKIADECWIAIPKHFPHAVLHEHIVMPNHVHAIIELTDANNVGANNHSPQCMMRTINGRKIFRPYKHRSNRHQKQLVQLFVDIKQV